MFKNEISDEDDTCGVRSEIPLLRSCLIWPGFFVFWSCGDYRAW